MPLTLPTLGLVGVLACAEEGSDWVPLPTEERVHRVSMALRAIRATADDVALVQGDPSALSDLAWHWLDSAAFGDTVMDLHNEAMLVRSDFEPPFEPIGPLMGHAMEDLFDSTSNEPLELIRHIVMADQSYATIVTSDFMLADERLSILYGLDRPVGAKGWLETGWSDGRPQAGVLSSTEVYRRHVSNGSNFHRGRANFLSTFLLCEDIGGRDVVVDGGVDLADEFAVAEAASTDAGCVSCHSTLDPLAAHLWGFKPQLTGPSVTDALANGCHWPHDKEDDPPGTSLTEDFCFPLRAWDDALIDDWALWNLPPPAFFGAATDGLVDLGRRIAEDGRFSRCAVRRAVSWFHQVPWQEVDSDTVERLNATFEDSGLQYKALVHAIVTDPEYLAGASRAPRHVPLGPLSVRPEQWARTVEAVTGFSWIVDPADEPCDTDCWDRTAMLRNDRHGFRALAGGIDGMRVVVPTHSPTPTQVIVYDQLADDAAGWAVSSDFALPADERRLLTDVEADTVDVGAVRRQIATLHRAITGETVDPASVPVGEALGLWQVVAAAADPTMAWEVVVAALLRDPRAAFY